jgi:hypothetical protein
MTLDEAIKHLQESLSDKTRTWCEECRQEHEQLLHFLLELKEFRSINEKARADLAREKEKAEYWHDKYDHSLHEQLKMEHELESCAGKIQGQREEYERSLREQNYLLGQIDAYEKILFRLPWLYNEGDKGGEE